MDVKPTQGVMMVIDLHGKSQQLLEALANSIHDRDPKNPNPFFFKSADILVAETWLQDFEKEIKNNHE